MKTKAQLVRFVLIGVVSVGIDYLVYLGSLVLIANTEIAKALGFGSGMLNSYLGNKYWTFEQKRVRNATEITRFALLYLTSFCANVSTNSISLTILEQYTTKATGISFLTATLVSLSMNFIGLKFFVFGKYNDD